MAPALLCTLELRVVSLKHCRRFARGFAHLRFTFMQGRKTRLLRTSLLRVTVRESIVQLIAITLLNPQNARVKELAITPELAVTPLIPGYHPPPRQVRHPWDYGAIVLLDLSATRTTPTPSSTCRRGSGRRGCAQGSCVNFHISRFTRKSQ